MRFGTFALSSNEGSDESAHAQTHLSLRCSHTQRKNVDEDSDAILDR